MCGAAMYLLAAVGLGLAVIRGRRGWRLQTAVLLGLTVLWAVALGFFLSDDSIGHDCTRADHSGEWPALIATSIWAAVLVAAFATPQPPAARLTARLGLPVLTVVLVGGTACSYSSSSQPDADVRWSRSRGAEIIRLPAPLDLTARLPLRTRSLAAARRTRPHPQSRQGALPGGSRTRRPQR